MRAPLTRLVRLGLVPAVAAGALLLAACTHPADPTPTEAPAPSGPIAPTVAGAGSDGLTVRYLDHGTVKTLHVEDFPH